MNSEWDSIVCCLNHLKNVKTLPGFPFSGSVFSCDDCDLLYCNISGFYRRNLKQSGEESLSLEGDIGGGLSLQRQISIPESNLKVLRINSAIIARNVGAGSGGFSRSVGR